MNNGYMICCGYCDATIEGDNDTDTHRKGQAAGWRYTYGRSKNWGEGAHNTCPDCVPIGAGSDSGEVAPLYVE
jgi:hypothetical protein